MSISDIHVRVVSKRAKGYAASHDETAIDVDRTHPQLGNPFILHNHNDAEERERVIAQYEKKLKADLRVNGPMSRALDVLALRASGGERLALRCWCAPRHCHAELLRDQIFLKLGIEENITKKPSNPKQMGFF